MAYPVTIANQMHLIATSFHLILCTVLISTVSDASDWLKEQHWNQAIQAQAKPEEITWLTTNKQKVLALYIEKTTQAYAQGIILLHDIDNHPDWPQVLHPLRIQLPQYGWSTLSVQMPVIANQNQPNFDRLLLQAEPRITAAINFLKNKQIEQVILLGHGVGATLAAAYTEKYIAQSPEIIALIGIGFYTNSQTSRWLNITKTLPNIPISILDIFGQNDRPWVLNSANERLQSARQSGKLGSSVLSDRTIKVQQLSLNKTGNRRFRQIKILGADHDFLNQTTILIKHIRGWLKKNIAHQSP